MNKFVTVKEAADKIHDGMTVMVGGFLGVGNPIALIDALVEKGVKDLPSSATTPPTPKWVWVSSSPITKSRTL